MSEIASLKKSLPEMNHNFSINEEGLLTKKQFEGNFACKIPNIKIQAQIAKHKAMLNSGFEEGLDIGTRNLHHMISYLRYTLTETPKWWKDADLGYDLYDINVIESVYAKVLEFEKSWYESVWGKEEPLKEDAESDKA